MKLQELIDEIESVAPLAYQESYDNAGLIVGSPEDDIHKALLCLDSTEAVIDEAIAEGCDLVIAHHPVIFGGLKKLNGKTDVERAVIKAIRHGIAIYAAHTNLDNVLYHGVNEKIAQKLGLQSLSILSPKANTLLKLVTYCPNDKAGAVCDALFAAGAGSIGHYDECSFNVQGTGSFRGDAASNPSVGVRGERHYEPETKIEVIVPVPVKSKVLKALFEVHPYEEVAYQLIQVENANPTVGSGIIGSLEEAMETQAFLGYLKERMALDCFKYTHADKTRVKTVAICGGSGSFLLPRAIAAGADVFITSDIKYHEFFGAENRLIVCDIGHYESEIFTLSIFYELINKKFPTFAVIFAKTNTNPITYFK